MRADGILGLLAANKSLLLSDPVSVCSMERSPECLCACVFIYQRVCRNVCVHDLGVLVSEKEMKSIVCFLSLPHGEPFLFITSPALPCAPVLQPTCKICLYGQKC